MSEEKEYFRGKSVDPPYELTLPKVVWAVICGLVMGALLYPFAAKADPGRSAAALTSASSSTGPRK